MSVRVCNQDPAGDMGRRAARAGLPITVCPYPEGNWLGDRWRAAHRVETLRLGRRPEDAPCAAPAVDDWCSGEDLESIARLFGLGHSVSYIAIALQRSVPSVQMRLDGLLSGEIRLARGAAE